MAHAGFVHLRVHSAYSLSEGAIRVAEIAALSAEHAMPAVALTDTANMFGALEFSQYCAGRGVQPIIGCQLALRWSDQQGVEPAPVVVLARDEAGLANVQRLSSAGFLGGGDGSLGLDIFAAHAEGVFLLSGGTTGPLGRLLADGQEAEALHLLERLARAFPDSLAVELHRHGLPVERVIEPTAIHLADRLGLPLVATNDCFFAHPAMHEAHDALLCIAAGRTLAQRDRRRATPEHWLKPAPAMRALFADVPEACDNTLAIARRCAVSVQGRKPLLPTCPKVRPGRTEHETVVAMAREGLEARLGAVRLAGEAASGYRERLDYELGVIGAMGFSGYFLIVADFIQWAKAQGIPVGPGRGSGAGSVVAWSLTITDLDPIRWGLLFERFLNPERISMPDFDIDFCQDRRDEVIDYVRREYGHDRVAQIITFGKLQARAVTRDVGRVLGLPFGLVNKVAELIPNNPAKPTTLQQAIDGEARLREMRDGDDGVRRLLEIALQLEGLYRHASTHAAGVVIGDRPLAELIPLYRDPKADTLVSQYNMKYVEQAGLVKFDFLGLTTLTILDRAEKILARRGVALDIAAIPLDDPATYAMLGRGDAGGVFQFESAGMRDVLRQMRPDRLEDLIAAVALYRPGPMANIPAYCQRKHGAAWSPPDPSLRDILQETYGIMVYQEQVMQIAQSMAGYSLGAADSLRRAMGKKIRAEMDQHRRGFCDGARSRGHAAEKAEEVFELMAKFADYGFNKSHAAAYALLSYQTAWLRANQPVAFIAACMSLAIGNTDKLAALHQEASHLGVRVLPPDVNASEADFAVEATGAGERGAGEGGEAVRYALGAIKRVSMTAMRALVAARGDRPFASLADLVARVDGRTLNRAQMESLIKAGALDRLDPARARLHAGADLLVRHAAANVEASRSQQIGLFGAAPDAPVRLPAVPEWDGVELLAQEADAIGFYLTAHPLEAFAPMLASLGAVPLARVASLAEPRLRFAGCVVGVKERITKTGARMAWVSLSDATAAVEVTLFSEVLGAARPLLVAGRALLVTAEVKREGETARITALAVAALDEVHLDDREALELPVADVARLPALRELLAACEGGRSRVALVPEDEAAFAIELPQGFRLTSQTLRALRRAAAGETV